MFLSSYENFTLKMLQQQHFTSFCVQDLFRSNRRGVASPRDAGTQNAPSCRVLAAAAMPTVGDEVYRLGLDLSNEARRVDEMGIVHRKFQGPIKVGDSLAELLTPGVDVDGRCNELGRWVFWKSTCNSGAPTCRSRETWYCGNRIEDSIAALFLDGSHEGLCWLPLGSVSERWMNFTCQQGGPDARQIPDANALQSKIIKPIGSMVLVYMLTWPGYSDGKCYIMLPYIAYMDPMGKNHGLDSRWNRRSALNHGLHWFVGMKQKQKVGCKRDCKCDCQPRIEKNKEQRRETEKLNRTRWKHGTLLLLLDSLLRSHMTIPKWLVKGKTAWFPHIDVPFSNASDFQKFESHLSFYFLVLLVWPTRRWIHTPQKSTWHRTL